MAFWLRQGQRDRGAEELEDRPRVQVIGLDGRKSRSTLVK
jgi:hypothetical protein